MTETIKDSYVKRAAKRHRCDWCGEYIEIGEPSKYRAYKLDQEFVQSYQHPECFEAMMNSREDFESNEYVEFGYARGRTKLESEGFLED